MVPLFLARLRPVLQLRRFFVKRAESVRKQLAGKSEGHLFGRRHAFDKPTDAK
jgi:hypothetical protein